MQPLEGKWTHSRASVKWGKEGEKRVWGTRCVSQRDLGLEKWAFQGVGKEGDGGNGEIRGNGKERDSCGPDHGEKLWLEKGYL